jgi:hypothetical protein
MLRFSSSIRYGFRRRSTFAEAKKNRQGRWRFFGNSGLLDYALTPLSIRQRTEMPKEVKVKLRGHDGDEAR